MNASPLNAATLDSCADEPITIPGAIQPHGALLTLREPDLVCLQATSNAEEIIGIPAALLTGRALGEGAGNEFQAQIAAALAAGDPAMVSPLEVELRGRFLHASMHRGDGILFVELEPVIAPLSAAGPHPQRLLQRALAAMRAAETLSDLYPIIARTVAALSGFERVMVYRFDADWHGEVVGEALAAEETTSYLGLHFPASDIPVQARALYEKSWLRLIATVDYTPARLEPVLNPLTGAALDLSFATLRSVSPIHLEYLRNMGVGASMSVSLMDGGKLWGLVACHHRQPHFVAPAARGACELFGQAASTEIAARRQQHLAADRERAQRVQTRFFDIISGEDDVFAALVRYTPQLLEFMGAHGAAVWVAGRCMLLGQTPPQPAVDTLIQWLEGQDLQPLLATDSLGALLPEAAAWADVASGLLAVRLSRVEAQFVLWFRPETVVTVHWAGDPRKPVEPGLQLHPRRSFADWQEMVRGRSRVWSEPELDGARQLHLALNALVLRRSEGLLKLNRELEHKNTDLTSFAHIAAHDLREPLRGINNFSRFLRDLPSVQGDPEAARLADSITLLSARVDDLLEALLHYSEVGRIDLRRGPTSLDRLLDETLENVGLLLAEKHVDIRRPGRLPTVNCDPVLIREVFSNLITNACKYSPGPDRWVEIGWREPVPENGERGPVIYVRDGGIGIRSRHHTEIFQIFRRLHGRDQYGGGSGVGLAIVRNIVERHGGWVRVESEHNQGATFSFTLS